MSEVREEYTAENYPSFGKKYNDEKAIISLTSWKGRISTVSKTLYSLLTQCPGFHIVLVLSEEEFPKMMNELPENLKLFVDNELIEILWVYKNYKSFKKVLFTMDKYRDVPIISADDDCIYKFNYAQELYNNWKKNQSSVIRYPGNKNMTWNHSVSGPWTIYPKFNLFGKFGLKILFTLSKEKINASLDDDFYCEIIRDNNISHFGLKNVGYKGLIDFFAQNVAIHNGWFE